MASAVLIVEYIDEQMLARMGVQLNRHTRLPCSRLTLRCARRWCRKSGQSRSPSDGPRYGAVHVSAEPVTCAGSELDLRHCPNGGGELKTIAALGRRA